jgi:hypothetical protein
MSRWLQTELVDTVQVVQEVLQLAGSIGQMTKVSSAAKPAEGLVGGQVKNPLLKVLHAEVGDDQRQ